MFDHFCTPLPQWTMAVCLSRLVICTRLASIQVTRRDASTPIFDGSLLQALKNRIVGFRVVNSVEINRWINDCHFSCHHNTTFNCRCSTMAKLAWHWRFTPRLAIRWSASVRPSQLVGDMRRALILDDDKPVSPQILQDFVRRAREMDFKDLEADPCRVFCFRLSPHAGLWT